MSILLWVLFGAIAGLVAKPLMPGPNAGGLAAAIPLGVAGALVGGLSGAALAGQVSMNVDSRSLIMAMISSMVVLICYRSYAMRSEHLRP